MPAGPVQPRRLQTSAGWSLKTSTWCRLRSVHLSCGVLQVWAGWSRATASVIVWRRLWHWELPGHHGDKPCPHAPHLWCLLRQIPTPEVMSKAARARSLLYVAPKTQGTAPAATAEMSGSLSSTLGVSKKPSRSQPQSQNVQKVQSGKKSPNPTPATTLQGSSGVLAWREPASCCVWLNPWGFEGSVRSFLHYMNICSQGSDGKGQWQQDVEHAQK